MTMTTLTQNLKDTYGTMYYVSDMKKTIDWYKNFLGLSPSYESAEWTEFPVNNHSICLHNIEPHNKKATSGFIILNISNIQTTAAELKKRGVKMDEINEVCPGAYAVNIYDPDGNIIGLYEGPKSSNAT